VTYQNIVEVLKWSRVSTCPVSLIHQFLTSLNFHQFITWRSFNCIILTLDEN